MRPKGISWGSVEYFKENKWLMLRETPTRKSSSRFILKEHAQKEPEKIETNSSSYASTAFAEGLIASSLTCLPRAFSTMIIAANRRTEKIIQKRL